MSQRIVPMEELPHLVGQTFRKEEFRISQHEIDTFEDVTGVTAIYQETLADDYPDGMIEGFHSLSLLDYLTNSMIRPDPATCYVFNYGVDKVRFMSSMTIEDTLYFELDVLEAEPRNGGYLMKYRATIGVAGRDKPGMVAIWLGLALPRTTTEFKEKRVPTSPTTHTKGAS